MGRELQSLLLKEANGICSNYYSSSKTPPCLKSRAVFPSIATHTLVIEKETKPEFNLGRKGRSRSRICSLRHAIHTA
jgi:hypothetical protein